MSWLLRKATVRNENRALKEVNAFEWERDYRPATRQVLKEILEDRMEEELEEYLGRGSYEWKEREDWDDYRNGPYVRHLLTDLGDISLRVFRSRKGFKGKAGEDYRSLADEGMI